MAAEPGVASTQGSLAHANCRARRPNHLQKLLDVACVTILSLHNAPEPAICEQLTELGLLERTVIQLDPLVQGGVNRKRCAIIKSHVSAWAEARQRKCENLLVFESDAFLEEALIPLVLPRVTSYLRSGADYDFFFLGCATIAQHTRTHSTRARARERASEHRRAHNANTHTSLFPRASQAPFRRSGPTAVCTVGCVGFPRRQAREPGDETFAHHAARDAVCLQGGKPHPHARLRDLARCHGRVAQL